MRTRATRPQQGPAGQPPSRPLVGPLLVAVGLTHVGVTPLAARPGLRGILRAGLLDGVHGRAAQGGSSTGTEREHAFWFATTGAALVAVGGVVTELERTGQPLPRSLPLILAGLGVWGAVPLPRSPFWVLLLLAALAGHRRREGSPVALPSQSGGA